MSNTGAQYSKGFRKAGIAWGKGNLDTAIAILQAGMTLAIAQGDATMAHLMRADLERYQRIAQGTDVDMTR
jgi:hypothetical protein